MDLDFVFVAARDWFFSFYSHACHKLSTVVLFFFFSQLRLNETLYDMVALVARQSPIVDSTELWGTLDAISEALGNTMGVVSYWLREEFLGNATNSTMTPHENYTNIVSTCLSLSSLIPGIVHGI